MGFFTWWSEWKTNRRLREVAKYNAERDAMLRSLDPIMFMGFNAKWKIGFSHNYRSNTTLGRHLILLTMHKTRLQIVAFTPEEKLASARWIVANNFNLPEPMYFENGKLMGAEYADDSHSA